MIDGFSKELTSHKSVDDVLLELAPEVLENEEI